MNEPLQLYRLQLLNRKVLNVCFLNLFLVAASGLLLRSIPVFNIGQISFVNLLHGHSHFAFGGWVTPAIIWMLIQYFPNLQQVNYKTWRNVFMLLFLSAYGMLLSFPFQGYSVISILFSSLSVAGTYYFAFVAWKAIGGVKGMPAQLLRAAIIFLIISAIGPFATGPMKALGLEGSVLYYDAVYYYLHFQYNGWFTFGILAILYQRMEQLGKKYNRTSFYYFVTGCVLTFFLSILWSKPHGIFYFAGGLGAVLQLAGGFYLLKDSLRNQSFYRFSRLLERMALAALLLKLILQAFSALPSIVQLTAQNRNLLIAYLHLVMLGFVSIFVFATVVRHASPYSVGKYKLPVFIFIATFVLSELLLMLSPMNENILLLDIHLWLFVISCGFLYSTFFMLYRILIHQPTKDNRVSLLFTE